MKASAAWAVPLVVLTVLSPTHFLLAETVVIPAKPSEYEALLYFEPSNATVSEGSEFEAVVRIDTQGSTVNSVDLDISFPADLLSVVNVTSKDSIVPHWITTPAYSSDVGSIELAGVVPGGVSTADGVLANVRFRALKAGTGQIEIKKSTRVLANDGLGSDTAVKSTALSIVISPAAPGAPSIRSTHPSYEWTNRNDPVFEWKKSAPDEAYSFVLDMNRNTVPDDIVDGTEPKASYADVSDGIWFFHLKLKRGDAWGKLNHYEIRIDTEPPADLEPVTETGGARVVSFTSTDALSGIDHYEVGIFDLSFASSTSLSLYKAESPYSIPEQTPPDAVLIVRAVDKAGNIKSVLHRISPSASGKATTREMLSDLALFLIFLSAALILGHYRATNEYAKLQIELWKRSRERRAD